MTQLNKATYKTGLTLVWSLSLLLGACAPQANQNDNAVNTEITSNLDLSKDNPFYIINGQPVVQTTDNFSSSIVGLFSFEDNSLCTGSIIHAQYIITAAHCLAKDPRNMVVLFGSNFETALKEKHFLKVADGLANPLYNHKMQFANRNNTVPEKNWGDIALIKIDQPLPRGYRPIPVTALDVKIAHQESVLAGYGMFNGVTGEGSGVLRKTLVQIENPAYSQSEASIDQTHGTGACHGDSGGPAYIKTPKGFALWGVTSRGLKDPKNDCSQYSVYTKLASFRLWVVKAQELLQTRKLPPHRPLPPPSATGNRFKIIPK